MARIEVGLGGKDPSTYLRDIDLTDAARSFDISKLYDDAKPLEYEWDSRFHGAVDGGDWTYGGKPISGDQVKPLTLYPKGVRWPWYPAFWGLVVMEDQTFTDDGLDVTMRSVGKITKGRVGIRAWAKELFKRSR